MEGTDPINPVVHTTEFYVKEAKLRLLQEIYRKLDTTMDSLDLNGNDRMEINNVLSNIHKEHGLG